jgi:hypothetical protein
LKGGKSRPCGQGAGLLEKFRIATNANKSRPCGRLADRRHRPRRAAHRLLLVTIQTVFRSWTLPYGRESVPLSTPSDTMKARHAVDPKTDPPSKRDTMKATSCRRPRPRRDIGQGDSWRRPGRCPHAPAPVGGKKTLVKVVLGFARPPPRPRARGRDTRRHHRADHAAVAAGSLPIFPYIVREVSPLPLMLHRLPEH